jgi:predicted O-linked N-acetylglucosamine transferase (SPINDLY family)
MSSADDALNRARYRHVDVVLDTLPYTGGDSTVAALDMAVPVVTLAGDRQAQRMGLSLLTHLGVTDTIAWSDEEYVALAIRLATDAAWRATISARIAERVTSSGIADLDRYTRDLERALERAITSANELKERR